MSRIHEFLKKPRKGVATEHKQARDLYYMASYLDGRDREELEALAKYGFKSSLRRSGRDQEDHMNRLRSIMQDALKEMGAALDGDFDCEQLVWEIEYRAVHKFGERIIKAKEPVAIHYIASFLDQRDQSRLDAFADCDFNFRRTAEKTGLSIAYLRMRIPTYVFAAIRRMCNCLGGQLEVSGIIMTRERHNMERLESQRKLAKLNADIAAEKQKLNLMTSRLCCGL